MRVAHACICVHRMQRGARADRQMRDTLAWPLSSWTASADYATLRSDCGDHMVAAPLHLPSLLARERPSPFPLFPSLSLASSIVYNPFPRAYPLRGVCEFICRALPLLPRKTKGRSNAYNASTALCAQRV